MFLFVIIWLLVNLGLLQFAKWSKYRYETAFCRDIRANLGMFAYKNINFIEDNEELKGYSEKLSERKQIIVANKSDVLMDETKLEELKEVLNLYLSEARAEKR